MPGYRSHEGGKWSIITNMRELPLNALRAFTSTYAYGGIRAAARELGIAHSSVSRHLAELTAWLGVPLTEGAGGRRGLTFTPQGEALGRAVLAGMRDIETAVAALREAKSGNSVTLSTTPSFAARWLLPRLPAFEEAHPRIEISVLVDQRTVTLEDRDVDLAVRMGSGPWPESYCEPLMDEELYPVMSPAFWERAGKPRRTARLAGLRLLHDRDLGASWDLWRRAHGPKSLDLQRGPRFASSDLLLRAAAQGQGVALARHRLAAEDVASGLLLRPFQESSVHIDSAYWLVLSRRSRSRAAVTTFVDWIKTLPAVPRETGTFDTNE